MFIAQKRRPRRRVFAYRTVDGPTGQVTELARMHADGVMLEYPLSATASGRRRAAVELVHRHGAADRPQERQDRRDAARLQGAARRGQARRRQHPRKRTRQQITTAALTAGDAWLAAAPRLCASVQSPRTNLGTAVGPTRSFSFQDAEVRARVAVGIASVPIALRLIAAVGIYIGEISRSGILSHPDRKISSGTNFDVASAL